VRTHRLAATICTTISHRQYRRRHQRMRASDRAVPLPSIAASSLHATPPSTRCSVHALIVAASSACRITRCDRSAHWIRSHESMTRRLELGSSCLSFALVLFSLLPAPGHPPAPAEGSEGSRAQGVARLWWLAMRHLRASTVSEQTTTETAACLHPQRIGSTIAIRMECIRQRSSSAQRPASLAACILPSRLVAVD
jgi:hypothetical protein